MTALRALTPLKCQIVGINISYLNHKLLRGVCFSDLDDIGGKLINLTLKGKFFILLNTFNPKIHLFSPNSAKKIFFFSRKHIKLVGENDFSRKCTPCNYFVLFNTINLLWARKMTSRAFKDQAITHILTRLDVYSLNKNIKRIIKVYWFPNWAK